VPSLHLALLCHPPQVLNDFAQLPTLCVIPHGNTKLDVGNEPAIALCDPRGNLIVGADGSEGFDHFIGDEQH
jgi:hypothetical protein